MEPLIRSWWSMVGQFLLGSSPRNADAVSPETATLDFSNAAAEGRLDLGAAAGDTATAEAWLHNRGAGDMGQIRLRCSDLLAPDGSVIGSDAVTFDPALVPMPSRSSRGIDVKVQVPQGVQPDVYRGTVLVEGHSQLWLPVVRRPVRPGGGCRASTA
jgi:hypothetical protein